MAEWNDPQSSRTGFGGGPSLNGQVLGAETLDQGLRKHLLSIYNYMASGVLLTGVVAMLFAQSGVVLQIMGSPLGWLIKLAPLCFILAMSFGLNKMSTATLQALFWTYCTVMGLSLSTIFLAYTGGSIALAFFSASGAFAGLSLVGHTTKRDLSGMGAFMTMGLIGIIIASLLNIFLKSPGLYWATSILGVVIFAGLTAWHTQSLKQDYAYARGTELEGKVVIMGALSLYLDFINMFLYLLRFFGDRR